MESQPLNAEHAEIAELVGVLLCGLRGLCVELRIFDQHTEGTEGYPIFRLYVVPAFKRGASVPTFTTEVTEFTETKFSMACLGVLGVVGG